MRESLTKEGQHFQRFMLAFRRVCPEAFAKLKNEVLVPWCEADAGLGFIQRRPVSDFGTCLDLAAWMQEEMNIMTNSVDGDDISSQEFDRHKIIVTGCSALLGWLIRHNLCQNRFATSFLIGVLLHWGSDDELRESGELWVELIEKATPPLKVAKKPKPPEINISNDQAEADYREAAEEYIVRIREWNAQKRPSLLTRMYAGTKPASQNNPLHYEWAALYQCLEMSPGDICKMYGGSTSAEDSEMLRYITRTLEHCLISPRQGKAGKQRNNDAFFQDF